MVKQKQAFKSFDPIRALAVKKTARYFGTSETYVRMVNYGKRQNTSILKFYNHAYKEIESAAKL